MSARPIYYVLRGREPVPVEDCFAWAKEFARDDTRIVARTELSGPAGHVAVSTVFLGIDHGWDANRPVLFETMIFQDGAALDYQERYSTYDDAEAGHRRAVEVVKGWSAEAVKVFAGLDIEGQVH